MAEEGVDGGLDVDGVEVAVEGDVAVAELDVEAGGAADVACGDVVDVVGDVVGGVDGEVVGAGEEEAVVVANVGVGVGGLGVVFDVDLCPEGGVAATVLHNTADAAVDGAEVGEHGVAVVVPEGG